jgi:hypothetical protein
MALLAGLFGCATPPLASTSTSSSCAPLDGRTLVGFAWAEGGRRALVRTRAQDSETDLSVIDWPSRSVEVTVKTGEYESLTDAIDPDGNVYWLRSSTGAGGDSADLVRAALDGTTNVVGHYVGSYLAVHWGGAPIVVEVRGDEERLVALPAQDPTLAPREVLPWTRGASGFWVARDGDAIAWLEQAGAGEPTELVTKIAGAETRHRLPGLGGSDVSLYPSAGIAIYRRTETGRLTMFDPAANAIRGELGAREFAGGEASASGIFAALTHAGFHEANELCALNVEAALQDSASATSSTAPGPGPDVARKAKFLAWLPRFPRSTSVDLRLGLGADWDTIAFLPRTYDNVAAAAVFGASVMDFEQAARTTTDADTILVLVRGRTLVAWFPITQDEFDVRIAVGGSFGATEGACIDGPAPRFAGVPGSAC